MHKLRSQRLSKPLGSFHSCRYFCIKGSAISLLFFRRLSLLCKCENLSRSHLLAHKPLQLANHFPHIQGLGYMRVHAAGQTFLYILRKSICRHSDNGNIRILSSRLSDSLCSLIAIHEGHTQIHKDSVVIARLRRLVFFYAESAVFRPIQAETKGRKQFICNLPVQVIILRLPVKSFIFSSGSSTSLFSEVAKRLNPEYRVDLNRGLEIKPVMPAARASSSISLQS